MNSFFCNWRISRKMVKPNKCRVQSRTSWTWKRSYSNTW